MSFFCVKEKIKKRSVTLQVRILTIKNLIGRKRASLSASASLTLEAALVLPLFLFAGVILMMPFRVMDVHRQVQAVGEHVSEDIGQAAYLSRYKEEESFWNRAAAWVYAEAAVRNGLKDLPVERVSLLRSSFLEDGETVDLVVDYEVKMPFSLLGLESVELTNRSFRRAWVGEDGKSQGDQEEEEEDVIVYVGKKSTRYHVSRTCHYLHNDLTAVAAGEVEFRRNDSGGRYTPCARCGSDVGGTVYIMPSGKHYHSSPSCSAINAYAKAVWKSEAEHLGPCSYCGKKN